MTKVKATARESTSGVASTERVARQMSPERQEAHQETSLMVWHAARRSGGLRQVATALGISHTAMQQYADPDHRAAFAFRDALAAAKNPASKQFARAIADALKEAVEKDHIPVALEKRSMGLVSSMARTIDYLMQSLADDTIDATERREICRRMQPLQAQLSAFLREAREIDEASNESDK